ncbi:MAG: ABC transporter permease [Anaerolineae bacterium]|nr:ABC transporter permease [Anaerolineae bacterium]MDK1081208.1 ABC transporter permease [Anaerolineae bacterium]MDK1118349.1 ABC transporter permease [Anaerolineae bacterium]
MTDQIPSKTHQTQLRLDYLAKGYASFINRLKQLFFNGYAGLVYLFLYAPIILLVVYSFNESRFPTYWTGFTLQWYRVLFDDHLVGAALKNTLIVATSSTIISTIIGTMIAIGVERYRFRTKPVVDGLLIMPIIIPDIAMAIMLLVFFKLIKMNLGLYTIIIAHVAFNISFVAIIVRARMATLGTAMEEAASDLYANEWQTFWRVTFPLLIPGILGGALFAFTLSLDDFVITNFTSGPGSTTLPVRIVGMTRRNITPEINALSTLMLISAMTLVPLSLWLQRRAKMS